MNDELGGYRYRGHAPRGFPATAGGPATAGFVAGLPDRAASPFSGQRIFIASHAWRAPLAGSHAGQLEVRPTRRSLGPLEGWLARQHACPLDGWLAGSGRSVVLALLLAVLFSLLLGLLTAPSVALAGATQLYVDSAHVMAQAHHGAAFVRPRAVALDPAHGEVIVANTGLGRVEFFDYRTWPRGYFVHTVPGPDGLPEAGEPFALALDAGGRLLVSDMKSPVVDVLDYRGRSLERLVLPAPDDTAGGSFGPGAIAVAPDGRVFVASRGAGRVHVFDAGLHHLASWGVTGTDSTQLANITALAVDSAGRVFVACAMTTLAVQVFDASGACAFGFGRHDLGPGNFSLPSGIAFAPGGRVCVSDALRQVVQVFDSDGTFVGAVGGFGVGPGEFREPSALAGDGHGVLALAEKSGSRFQVLWLR